MKDLNNAVSNLEHLDIIEEDEDEVPWEDVEIPEFDTVDESENHVANPELIRFISENQKKRDA